MIDNSSHSTYIEINLRRTLGQFDHKEEPHLNFELRRRLFGDSVHRRNLAGFRRTLNGFRLDPVGIGRRHPDGFFSLGRIKN